MPKLGTYKDNCVFPLNRYPDHNNKYRHHHLPVGRPGLGHLCPGRSSTLLNRAFRKTKRCEFLAEMPRQKLRLIDSSKDLPRPNLKGFRMGSPTRALPERG